MSNSATVTPYASAPASSAVADGVNAAAGAAATLAGGAVVATVAIARFLCDETEAERAAVERLKAERRRDLLRPPHATRSLLTDSGRPLAAATSVLSKASGPTSRPPLATLPLTIRDGAALLSAAARLGYTEVGRSDNCWLLRNKTGEKLALHARREGITVVHAPETPRANVEALVRQHTMDQAIAHLQAQGMAPAATRLANGEVEIVAREALSGDDDDRAKVTVHVRRNGELSLDVDRCVGNRCEAIVKDLAAGVGGKVAEINKKDAYFRTARKKAIRMRI